MNGSPCFCLRSGKFAGVGGGFYKQVRETLGPLSVLGGVFKAKAVSPHTDAPSKLPSRLSQLPARLTSRTEVAPGKDAESRTGGQGRGLAPGLSKPAPVPARSAPPTGLPKGRTGETSLGLILDFCPAWAPEGDACVLGGQTRGSCMQALCSRKSFAPRPPAHGGQSDSTAGTQVRCLPHTWEPGSIPRIPYSSPRVPSGVIP